MCGIFIIALVVTVIVGSSAQIITAQSNTTHMYTMSPLEYGETYTLHIDNESVGKYVINGENVTITPIDAYGDQYTIATENLFIRLASNGLFFKSLEFPSVFATTGYSLTISNGHWILFNEYKIIVAEDDYIYCYIPDDTGEYGLYRFQEPWVDHDSFIMGWNEVELGNVIKSPVTVIWGTPATLQYSAYLNNKPVNISPTFIASNAGDVTDKGVLTATHDGNSYTINTLIAPIACHAISKSDGPDTYTLFLITGQSNAEYHHGVDVNIVNDSVDKIPYGTAFYWGTESEVSRGTPDWESQRSSWSIHSMNCPDGSWRVGGYEAPLASAFYNVSGQKCIILNTGWGGEHHFQQVYLANHNGFLRRLYFQTSLNS